MGIWFGSFCARYSRSQSMVRYICCRAAAIWYCGKPRAVDGAYRTAARHARIGIKTRFGIAERATIPLRRCNVLNSRECTRRVDVRSKRGIAGTLLLGCAAPVLSMFLVWQTTVAGELSAGAYAININPERYPVSVNGGMTDRQAEDAHDPLHARCLVLDNAETSLAIVVVDACMVPRDIFDAAKELAHERTGIPVEHMLMSATHTHTAVTLSGVFQSEPVEDYRRLLVQRIADGVEQAWKQREPARIGWAVGSDPSQVFNRRWFTAAGVINTDPFLRTTDVVRMNPGFDESLKTKPSGPVDPQVCIVSVQSRAGRPLALLANYSLHYVGGVPPLSADYFGEFARRFAQLIGADKLDPPFVGMMSNGTSGNINNVNYGSASPPRQEPFEQIQVVAASVADAAYKAYQAIEYHTDVPIAVVQREIELGVRLPSEDEVAQAKQWLAEAGPGPYRDRKLIYARETTLLAYYPRTVKVILQAMKIGDLGIVSSPCETFVETGLAIKDKSPLKPTFCIELANGYNGYLPTPEHHQWGGYETWRARSSYLAVDAEPKLRSTLLELLSEVAGVAKGPADAQ